EHHRLQELATGDARGREEDVVGRHQVVGGHDPIEILAGLHGESPLLLVAGPQTALDLAAHALQRRGGDDGLGGATDAEHHVDLLVVLGGGDGGGDVTVPEDGDSG